MKTTLAILAAVVMPGGFIILAVAAGTYFYSRYCARRKAAPSDALA